MVRDSSTCKLANSFRLDVILATGIAIAIFGIVQFFFFTSLAMTNYAGGSGLDADRAGRIESQHSVSYDWSRNFLSDLGREKAWSGTDNSVSSRYFNGTVIFLGIALGAFFAISVRASERGDAIALAAAAAGCISSFGLIGLGMTPYDRSLDAHNLMLALWILPLPVIAVAFAVQCFATGKWLGNVTSSITGLAAVILIATILIYAAAPSVRDHIIVQKVLVGVVISWFSIVVIRVAMAAIIVVTQTNHRNEQLAEQYLLKIRKHPRRREFQ